MYSIMGITFIIKEMKIRTRTTSNNFANGTKLRDDSDKLPDI
nr:hypothetical protein [Mycoplasmopsis bovis]